MRSICIDQSAFSEAISKSEETLFARAAKVPDHIYHDDYGTYCVQGIIQFIHTYYSDQVLGAVLADLPKLAIDSCSTLTGIATADHPPRGRGFYCTDMWRHTRIAQQLPFGQKAHDEYLELGKYNRWGSVSEYLRYQRLEPFLHEEMARRCRLRAAVPVEIDKERM